MSFPNKRIGLIRHPWLTHFESAPEQAFGELLAGHAATHPYEQADAPDAARLLFGPLDRDDPARKALGPAILSWLNRRRKEPLPAQRPKLQRAIRETCEAFEIVALLEIADVAADLQQRRFIWNDWVARLALSPTRDARAEYWYTLALTQDLVAENGSSSDPNILAPLWRLICQKAGRELPANYLNIGLLGLRRLPERGNPEALQWMSGLALWAQSQRPSDAAFKAEWFALKPLYTNTEQQWRKLLSRLLSSPAFKDADIEAPAWWHVDADFAPMSRTDFHKPTPLDWPSKQECDDVIAKFSQPFEQIEPLIDNLFERHRRYVYATGDAQFFIRAIHRLGSKLIGIRGDDVHARAKKIQTLAREGINWRPYDRHLWSLWREAFEADGAFEAAELLGWARIHRDSTDVDAYTQLATLLANSLDRFPDAEALLRNAVEKFPNDAHACTQLAELLIAENRLPEASQLLDNALRAGISIEGTYAARARLYANAGDIASARRVLKDGLTVNPDFKVLTSYRAQLESGKPLRLTTQAFTRASTRERGETTGGSVEINDPELSSVLRLGTVRRLRFRLEAPPGALRDASLRELQEILREDHTFSYAELLAARHRIWAAETDVLPPFAVAFENALATENREKLEQLAKLHPRLESLILVAQALLGDEKAQQKVEIWLREPQTSDKKSAIAGLHSVLRPVIRVTERAPSLRDAFANARETIVSALHDANEAALGEMLHAA